jgi:hypothetical protein
MELLALRYVSAGMRFFSVSQLIGRGIYLRRLWPSLYLITPNAGFREKPHKKQLYGGMAKYLGNIFHELAKTADNAIPIPCSLFQSMIFII